MAASEPAALSDARWRWPLLALCLLVLVLLAAQVVLHGPVLAFDRAASRYWMEHPVAALTPVLLWVSRLHQTAVLLAGAAVIALWRVARQDARCASAMLVVPTTMLLNVGAKNLFQRPRPHWVHPLVELATYSFPSGHAAGSTAFWGICCALVFARTRSRLWRAIALVVATAMVLLVCFSRVYLGAHYPSDVLGGIALGLSCVLVFLRLLRR